MSSGWIPWRTSSGVLGGTRSIWKHSKESRLTEDERKKERSLPSPNSGLAENHIVVLLLDGSTCVTSIPAFPWSNHWLIFHFDSSQKLASIGFNHPFFQDSPHIRVVWFFFAQLPLFWQETMQIYEPQSWCSTLLNFIFSNLARKMDLAHCLKSRQNVGYVNEDQLNSGVPLVTSFFWQWIVGM